jgi:hypothetical protein
MAQAVKALLPGTAGHHAASARFQAGRAATTSAGIATLTTLSGMAFIISAVSNA